MKRYLLMLGVALLSFVAIVPANAQQSIRKLTNKSGGTVAQYRVVIVDTSNASAFTTTATDDAARVVGVTAESINNNAVGTIDIFGMTTVYCSGSVAIGDYLATSNGGAGYAESNGTDINGSFAIALASGTNANVACLLLGPTPSLGSSSISPSSIVLGDGNATIIQGADSDIKFGYDEATHDQWEMTDAASNLLLYVKDLGTTGLVGASGRIETPQIGISADTDLIQLSANAVTVNGSITATGKVITAASASGGAGIILPPGAAPSAPSNGDMWSTSSGVYARVNGSTVGPFIQAGGDTNALYAGDTFSGDVTATLEADGDTALTIAANSVALTTDTSGNYVQDIAEGLGIDVSGASGEGSSHTISLDESPSNSGNHTLAANEWRPCIGGFVFEGSTVDGIETYLQVADPLSSDKTITLPNETGTVVTTGSTNAVTAAMTTITGTPDGSKYLRDDWTWQTPAGSSGDAVQVGGSNASDANFLATGNGIAISLNTTPSPDEITVALAALSADWSQTGAYDIILNNASSELKILESAGATYYGIFDVTDLSADRTYTFPNVSGTVVTTGDTNSVSDAMVVAALTLVGGSIDNTPIGASTRNTILATTIGANSVLTLSGGGTGSAAPTPQLNFSAGTYDNAGAPSVSHISLYGGIIGFGVSSNNLEIIASTGRGTRFWADPGATNPMFDIRGDSTVYANGNQLTASAGTLVAGAYGADTIALGTKTTGNYIATLAAGDGLSISGSGSETAAATVSFNFYAASGDQSFTTTKVAFCANGIVSEGTTADTIENRLIFADPSGSDKTITIPNTTGTVVTTGDSGTVTSAMVASDLANADVASNAAIAESKLAIERVYWLGAGSLWNDTCSAPALDSNKNISAAFAASQTGYFLVPIPSNYDGSTENIQILWARNDASNAVQWTIESVLLDEATALTYTTTTASTATSDTATGTTTFEKTSVSSGTFFGSSSNAGKFARVKITTNAFSGANPAYLMGLKIEY